jgi:hypothetical protein
VVLAGYAGPVAAMSFDPLCRARAAARGAAPAGIVSDGGSIMRSGEP